MILLLILYLKNIIGVCFFRLHQFEVYKELELTNIRKDVIGTVIVSRCAHCGKIKSTEVRTVNNYSI